MGGSEGCVCSPGGSVVEAVASQQPPSLRSSSQCSAGFCRCLQVWEYSWAEPKRRSLHLCAKSGNQAEHRGNQDEQKEPTLSGKEAPWPVPATLSPAQTGNSHKRPRRAQEVTVLAVRGWECQNTQTSWIGSCSSGVSFSAARYYCSLPRAWRWVPFKGHIVLNEKKKKEKRNDRRY